MRSPKTTWHRSKPTDELDFWRIEDLAHEDLPHPRVLINGSFDLLHASHLRLFHAAAQKAGPSGTIVLALDSDRLVRQHKGQGRPVLTWVERAAQTHWFCDRLVEIDSDEDFLELVNAVQPDLRVQGGDYEGKPSRIPWVPRLLIASENMRNKRGMRTSEIIERVVGRYGHVGG